MKRLKILECGKCKMLQLLEECKKVLTAQVVVKSRDVTLALCAFEDIILEIAQKPVSDITAKVLMKAKPFGIKHCDGFIRSINRKA